MYKRIYINPHALSNHETVHSASLPPRPGAFPPFPMSLIFTHGFYVSIDILVPFFYTNIFMLTIYTLNKVKIGRS